MSSSGVGVGGVVGRGGCDVCVGGDDSVVVVVVGGDGSCDGVGYGRDVFAL